LFLTTILLYYFFWKCQYLFWKKLKKFLFYFLHFFSSKYIIYNIISAAASRWFMQKNKFRFGFFSLMIILSSLLAGNKYTLLSFLAAFIHETGHLVASKLFNINIAEFKFEYFCARLVVKNNMSYIQEILLCLFGPLFNIGTALIAILMIRSFNLNDRYLLFFTNVSLFLGILNILPVRTFDGGKILEAILNIKYLPYISKKIIDILSFIIIFFMWTVSVYFILIYSTSLNLFVFSLILFFSLFVIE